jgi:hypothetical protein
MKRVMVFYPVEDTHLVKRVLEGLTFIGILAYEMALEPYHVIALIESSDEWEFDAKLQIATSMYDLNPLVSHVLSTNSDDLSKHKT